MITYNRKPQYVDGAKVITDQIELAANLYQGNDTNQNKTYPHTHPHTHTNTYKQNPSVPFWRPRIPFLLKSGKSSI